MCHILIKFVCCTKNYTDKETVSDPITIPESNINNLLKSGIANLENTLEDKLNDSFVNENNISIKK
jgi:hypothetical protein